MSNLNESEITEEINRRIFNGMIGVSIEHGGKILRIILNEALIDGLLSTEYQGGNRIHMPGEIKNFNVKSKLSEQFSEDGTFLDENGNRSIFDDVDK